MMMTNDRSPWVHGVSRIKEDGKGQNFSTVGERKQGADRNCRFSCLRSNVVPCGL